ncbi:IS110 family transposase [Schleiferilactobacillus harbinensis]|uniref:Transposase n=1 Tax=Schleiferilactobacillus harbinensis DSM 16991 TaxID=1122147 RepID=A0A0R1XMX4_9LACO|nr:IS110 family transposase [Schleiferilactobacillus harbinensis]KRM29017.1 transposase [Schleiferilactobacillus harbinensis DSM 16991]QFR62626.1 IS110 family transposase [Schleiferilactobacillus harbinensis]
MLYAGIDVAKNKHDVAVIGSDGTVYVRHQMITNNIEGFIRLKETLDNLIKATGEDIQVGLEDTGHYCYNIISFLREHRFSVFSYNPLIIKEFAKSATLRKTKTDRKDAMTIARKLLTDVDKVHFETNPHMIELKYATRYVARVKQDLTKQKIQYIRILDITFPELVKTLGGKNDMAHTQYVRALLKAYPSPRELSRAHLRTLTHLVQEASQGRYGRDRAIQIREAAKHTVGQNSAALRFELLETISAIAQLEERKATAEEMVNEVMQTIKSPLLTVPGIGNTLGSIILAELRNIASFRSPGQVLAFAGSEPSVSTSGENQVETGHMVKRGSPQLRWALNQAARLCAQYSPNMRRYFDKKLGEGKHYNVALSHVVKKLVRVIFHILKYNAVWEEEKLIVNQ